MIVADLRRYPVKSMAGESLPELELDTRGVVGDRWWAVEDGDGHFASGKNTKRMRRYDAVFAFAASTEADGIVVRSGSRRWVVGDEELDVALSDAFERPVRVTPEADIPHQDLGSISIVGSASIAWCAEHLGVDADHRRLRPNVLVETDEPFIEEIWVGRRIAIGTAVLEVVQRIERCRTIDLPQNGVTTPTPWLRSLAGDRDLRIGVYADVVTPGRLSIGDPVVARKL